MSALSSNSFDKISGNVKELSKKGNLKVKKHIIKEVEIWCKNTGIAQQFLDAICFLGSLNQYSKKEDITYDLDNSLQYIDLDLPGGVSSLQGLCIIFKIVSGYDDIFDFEALGSYSNFNLGEKYVKDIKSRPPINLDDIIDYEEYKKKLIGKLKMKQKKEPTSNLRFNGLFSDSDKRVQITDELYRILFECMIDDKGKLNAMISYLDFRTLFPELLIDVVVLMVLSEKEVRILFRSEKDKKHFGLKIFREKIENKLRELYSDKYSDEDENYDQYLPVNIDSPKFLREWNSTNITALGNKLMLDGVGNLHAKFFMNHRKGIVSSANMTRTSLTENIEVGAKVVNKELEDLQIFFDTAWRCVHG